MTLSLIYGRKYAQSKVGVVTFDTMVSEQHNLSSRVTYFPVERGSIVSDHIVNQPDIVNLSGLVTDNPLTILAPFNRSIAAFNALVEIHNRRQVVNVVTGIKIYKNMAITKLDVPRTIRTGQTLTFNIQLQKIYYDDEIQRLLDTGNVFSGVLDNTPVSIVGDSAVVPNFQQDPPLSFQDQATTQSNVGVQSLNAVLPAVLPTVLGTLALIYGVNNANYPV